MIVSVDNFKDCLAVFEEPDFYALDTETTGLRWWDEHRLFSIILASKNGAFYFNFLDKPDHLGNKAPEEYTLPREYLGQFKTVLDNKKSTWFMHNAKFDLGMISREGLTVAGGVHCTEAIARLLDPEHFSYTLDLCLKRMNTKGKHLYGDLWKSGHKDDAVEKYISKHKLYTEKKLPWSSKVWKDKRYDLVPFDIMSSYGLVDGKQTYKLGQFQRIQLKAKCNTTNTALVRVIKQERALTPVLFDNETHGFRLDVPRTEELIKRDQATVDYNKKKFKDLTGTDFLASAKVLAPIFDDLGIEYPRTEKGNPQFDQNFLDKIDHPLGETILGIKKPEKRINSYYLNFLHYRSKETGCVHPSYKQGGTATGRMSIVAPALQTVPKTKTDVDDDNSDAEQGAIVRSCFIPDDDCFLFSPDYDQMEYRLMVDQAGELELVEAINSGLDVHTATAELINQPRKTAKTINFLLLYGGGAQKLADTLGIPLKEARHLIDQYFQKLQYVQGWKRHTIQKCRLNGWGVNWFGRIYTLQSRWSYKAPNYSIQGGSADIVKTAMLRCQELLKGRKSRMTLQIHDELVFNIHNDDKDLQADIVDIMETAYPHKHLKLSAGPGYSTTHWGNKIDGYFGGTV